MLNVTAGHTISASFAANLCTVSALVGTSGHGTVTPAGTKSYVSGSTPTYLFTPERGYYASRLTVDGVAVDATVDPGTPTGASIPIEERAGEEVLSIDLPGGGAARLAPPGVSAFYPAFDVTPARLVDAIVTERGVARAPFAESLREQLAG